MKKLIFCFLVFCLGFFSCQSKAGIPVRDYLAYYLNYGETYHKCIYFAGQDKKTVEAFCERLFSADDKPALIESLNRGQIPGVIGQQTGYYVTDVGEDAFTAKGPGGDGLKYLCRMAGDSFIVQDSGSFFIHRLRYQRYAVPAVLDPGDKLYDFKVLGLEDLKVGHLRFEGCLHIREKLPFSELNVWIHRQKGAVKADYKKGYQFIVAFPAEGFLTDGEYSALTGPAAF